METRLGPVLPSILTQQVGVSCIRGESTGLSFSLLPLDSHSEELCAVMAVTSSFPSQGPPNGSPLVHEGPQGRARSIPMLQRESHVPY